jgi:PrpF protein
MTVLSPLAISIWEVQGRAVLVLRASDLLGKGRDRQGFARGLLAGILSKLSPSLAILEDLDPPDEHGRPSYTLGLFDPTRVALDYSARAARDANACLGFAAAAAGEFAFLTGKVVQEVVLFNTQEVLRTESAASLVGVTRMSSRNTSGASKLLPSCAPSHRLSSGLEISVVDAGQPLLLVRADAIGASGREPQGRRFKSKLTQLQWDELYDEVSGILDPQDSQEVRLLGLERARELPLVWIAPPGSESAEMDCTTRYSADGKFVTAMPGSAQLTLVAAASVPGTVLQQITRTLPGLDCRLGLGGEVLVASADTSQPQAGQARLLSLTMHQSVRCVMRGHIPL